MPKSSPFCALRGRWSDAAQYSREAARAPARKVAPLCITQYNGGSLLPAHARRKAPTMEMTIRTIPCAPDDEGEVVATLLSAAPAMPSGRGVLYLHGFVDYYFHDHVAQEFLARGYAFHALELRKYGRSLRAHQSPNFCRSLSDYYEELDKALELMAADGITDVTLLGHSTGGLLALLYAADGAHRQAIRRIILNSPFLDFREPALTAAALKLLSNSVGRLRPRLVLPKGLDPNYGASLHASRRGEWDFNLAWKPLEGFPIYMGWVRAVAAGQRRAQAGLGLAIPILLLHSDKSIQSAAWSDDYMRADGVLNVAHMRRYGPGLGREVELHEVPGGMHDLFLSPQPVRDHALAATFAWLERRR